MRARAMGNFSTTCRLPYYDTSPYPYIEPQANSRWMSMVPDNWSITYLSIPGTHHSMSYHGGPLVQTQTWPLQLQLETGIRFFDICCRHYRDNLLVYHGNHRQHVTFDWILRQILHFLEENPSETVLIRLKADRRGSENSEEIHKAVERIIQENIPEDRFWTGHHPGCAFPNMGDVRSKLVLINKYEDEPMLGVGISHDIIDVSEEKYVPTFGHINRKWGFVQRHLQSAANNSRDGRMYITFAYSMPEISTLAKR